MKTILVDDELWALKQFEYETKSLFNLEIIGKFSDPEEALRYAAEHKVEFALLDIEMPNMDGIELGKRLRQLYPQIVIVYVSSHADYFPEAYRDVHADYYLMKPYEKGDVEDVIQRALLLSKRQRKRVYVRTFGRFDVFVDDVPICFSNAKAKELLAICVNRRGGIVTIDEAIATLWEDSPVSERLKTRYRKAVLYLRSVFKNYGVPGVFISSYGSCYVDRNEFDCDFYEFLENGNPHVFQGEYMYEYSWAEPTVAFLERQSQLASLE